MKFFPIFMIVSLVLLTRLFFYFDEREELEPNVAVELEHTFTKEPKKSEFGQYFYINNLMVSIPKLPIYEYGDSVLIGGVPELKRSDKGEILVLSNPEIKKIDNPTFLSVLKPIRQKVQDSVMSSIPSREAGLLLGILLGVRDQIDPDYYMELRNAGVLHVIAASGQNVSILATLIFFLFERIARRKTAIILSSGVILLYALLTGFDPPIVRASIMAILTLGALFLGKQSGSLYILFITAFVMLIVNPSLIEDISFILSFLSTLGIVTLNPIFNRYIKFRSLTLLKDDILTSISAQLATFPILITFFSEYSIVSLPVNILVTFTIPFVMVIGGIGAILSMIHPILALPFYYLTYPFLSYFGFVVGVGSNLDIMTRFDSIPPTILLGYYILFVVFIYSQTRKNPVRAQHNEDIKS